MRHDRILEVAGWVSALIATLVVTLSSRKHIRFHKLILEMNSRMLRQNPQQ